MTHRGKVQQVSDVTIQKVTEQPLRNVLQSCLYTLATTEDVDGVQAHPKFRWRPTWL